jgi:hypothetical protein
MLDGSVNQSAVQMTSDVPEALSENTLGAMVRAVVLAVYYPEEDTHTAGNWATLVDVRTLGEKSRYLSGVPVYELTAGLYDEDIRTPRPASVKVGGGALVTEASGPSGPVVTEPSATDGDVVMIGWEDGDPKKPFCMPFGPPHPKRTNFPALSSGRVRRIRHNGTIIEIDKDGNVTIDASAAKNDSLAADGSQVANASGGSITIKTNASPGLLNLQEATDFALKGTTFWTELQKVMTELSAWAATATGTAFVGPGAALVTKITAFQAAASSVLSTRIKTG